ncbi:sugar-binding transcriptional regulator [Hoeflea poritis]|uniref:Sugar-binding transcriptional regulator n=1 Tax=Hoeflea poritis TaxID=2993659 RepID=A0ABT4VK12_9HYPH|nr:sugar-binding transcriptional regulator [Hoeflea poritis]MDA4845072.1 sugar-binding transcriptional regulator [Hoeflea poritis]
MGEQAKKSDIRRALHQDSVLANTAILYYKEGLTQNEIALRLGVSRQTVINYLRLAREQNIVDIRINGASFTVSNTSRDLRAKYKLADVYIAGLTADGDSADVAYKAQINRQVAQVGAMALHEILQPGELVGIAWGETIYHLANEAPYRIIEDLTVCQIIGSMTTPLVMTAEGCAISLASRLGAECHTLHAPAILTSVDLAEALRNEPVIREQLERLKTIDRSVFSVGNCDSDTPIVQSAITTDEEFDWYRARGAVGVLCGRFIDSSGTHIKGPMDGRMIGIDLSCLKERANGILVAGGPAKFDAISATLNGGYVSHLVTDERTAQALLEI